jgi:hypothetical protein
MIRKPMKTYELTAQLKRLRCTQPCISRAAAATSFSNACVCRLQPPGNIDTEQCTVLYIVGSSSSGLWIDIPGEYNYIQAAVDLLPTLQSAIFFVRIPNDFIVVLSEFDGIYDDNTFYEIDIGGWHNLQSAIRYISVYISFCFIPATNSASVEQRVVR